MSSIFGPISYGSTGDIYTTITLVRDTIGLLTGRRHVREATAFREILHQYVFLLTLFDRLLRDRTIQRRPDAWNALKLSITNCDAIVIKIRRYLEDVTQNPAVIFRGPLGSIFYSSIVAPFRWTVSRGELIALHKGFQRHVDIINCVLNATKLQVVPTIVRDLQPYSETVTLLDMLDQRMPIPVQVCADKEQFHRFLGCLFDNRAGKALVQRRDYSIVIQANDGPLNDVDWLLGVQPGTVLVMSALLRIADKELHKCPNCETFLSHQGEGEIVCAFCATKLRIMDAPRQGHPNAAFPPEHPDAPRYYRLEEESIVNDDDERSDLRFIRRYNVEVPKYCSSCLDPMQVHHAVSDPRTVERYKRYFVDMLKLVPKELKSQPICDSCTISRVPSQLPRRARMWSVGTWFIQSSDLPRRRPRFQLRFL
ncbi:unnamed protein product [Somion occarium]|uniref:Ubiquitin-like domain-containing protein n=1 Tax=Somion occarium TaxID=3059160 RepID=A0ABP1DUP4_9APHY